MKIQKYIVALTMVAFLMGFMELAFAQAKTQPKPKAAKPVVTKGVITKIAGDTLFIKDNIGKLTTIISSQSVNFKVGDNVIIKDGKISKVTEKPKGKTPSKPAPK